MNYQAIKASFFVLFLTTLAVAHAQQADLVSTAGIQSVTHQENIGKIVFTEKRIPTNVIEAKDFLSAYTLTNKSNLYFVAFMDNSLTNYLHQLDRKISADSLVKIGNYQFTILVDNQVIYISNLLPGAPRPKDQDTATTINRPLIDNENGYGSWSESFWNRFLQNGGDGALTDGIHRLEMEIRPCIMHNGIQTGPLMAKGGIKVNVRRNVAVNLSAFKLNKIRPYDGFEVSKEHFKHSLIRRLKASIDAGVFKRISSVVVIKNGKLLIEEYFNGSNRETLHDPRSVGKSFTSTLVGMAIQDGYLRSEDQRLKEFYHLPSFSNYVREKDSITLKDLLTMSSGFDGDDGDDRSPGNEENMYPTNDWVKFALDLPFSTDNAGKWHYFTAGVVVLGDILNKTVKGGLKSYAEERLFKPLHIQNYKWQYTPQRVPNTAGGIQMNTLDFAKYGQLYQNDGLWLGQQVLSNDWADKSFSRQKMVTGRNGEYYGYLFWNKQFAVNNKTYEAYYCAGNGGNYILMFKDQPLVVVITATAYGQPYAHPQVAKMLSEFILPAVID